MRRIVKAATNQKGQMAIFVALIFQVLFVFFAMAINVALVVHDKINLQNAVDLAAYYAAAKQAEILNAIAHQNYQIRQSWKLLAYRYYVIGSMGRISPAHPALVPPQQLADQEWVGTPLTQYALCIGYAGGGNGPGWRDVPPNQNICKDQNVNVRQPPRVPNMALGFLQPLAEVLVQVGEEAQARFQESCRYQGFYNWLYVNSILAAFRRDMSNRTKTIYGLANLLTMGGSSGGNGQRDFLDLDGQSVLKGAYRTFLNNLTWGNRNSAEGVDFDMYNSLGSEGIQTTDWLKKVVIYPQLIYRDVSIRGGRCRSEPKAHGQPPSVQDSTVQSLLNRQDVQELATYVSTPLQAVSSHAYTWAVEKNPHYMAYVMVKGRTRPRQLFFPLGGPVQMEAYAVAKPFGGRVGPWYSTLWPAGSPTSASGEKTDPLAPSRLNGPEAAAENQEDFFSQPNFSRFPGDTLGLRSTLAQAAMLPPRGLTSIGEYQQVSQWISPDNPQPTLVPNPNWRQAEMAAIAPNLFDIYYYSIDADYVTNYFQRLQEHPVWQQVRQSDPSDPWVLRSDLGPPPGDDGNHFSVRNHIELGQQSFHKPEGFYFVKDPTHLFTSWASNPTVDDHSFPENFGRCSRDYHTESEGEYPSVPGCPTAGGRTGYSVKFISRAMLKDAIPNIGGPGITAPIANPPPEEF